MINSPRKINFLDYSEMQGLKHVFPDVYVAEKHAKRTYANASRREAEVGALDRGEQPHPIGVGIRERT